MRHKDVKTVVDWLFSVTPSQLLQPKQIQSFRIFFCLDNDIIVTLPCTGQAKQKN